jgi:hypothetical protein
MDHHGIEYKEITAKHLMEFLEKRDKILFKVIMDQWQSEAPVSPDHPKVSISNNFIGEGIIDDKPNPFSHNMNDWIEHKHPLTPHRQRQVSELFGKDIKTISNIKPENIGKYPAFVAIRWGFATINGEILTQTEKWDDRYNYELICK